MRTKKSIINVLVGSSGLFVTTIFSFITRTIFIKYLGETYLGLMGLFSNILVMLSIAELGVGNAIIYSLYKPLVEKDYDKIKSLMNLYKKYYQIIGTVILIIGISIIPFLDIFVNSDIVINNLILLYILSLLNTVTSYWFFSYKRSIFIADQNAYLVNIICNICSIVMYIIQIITLIIFKNFILYLILQLIFGIVQNLIIGLKANKEYRYLKEKEINEVSLVDKQKMFSNIKAIFISRLSWSFLVASDNIVISTILGVRWVGLYSNYYMIMITIDKVLYNIFNSIKGSIGNLNVKESVEKKVFIFNRIFFISIWLYGVSAICIYILGTDLIKIWIGKQYILNNNILILIVFVFYINGIQITSTIYRETLGLFKQYKYLPVLSVILNIIFSVILCINYGIAGVCIGTIISKFLIQFWVDPFVVFNIGFGRSSKKYFYDYFTYSFILCFVAILIKYSTNFLVVNNFGDLVIKAIVVFVITNLFLIISFKNREEFKYLQMLVNTFINKLKIKLMIQS